MCIDTKRTLFVWYTEVGKTRVFSTGVNVVRRHFSNSAFQRQSHSRVRAIAPSSPVYILRKPRRVALCASRFALRVSRFALCFCVRHLGQHCWGYSTGDEPSLHVRSLQVRSLETSPSGYIIMKDSQTAKLFLTLQMKKEQGLIGSGIPSSMSNKSVSVSPSGRSIVTQHLLPHVP